MLAAYFDESVDKNNRILVVVCLVAHGDRIAKLERAWASRLSKVNASLVSNGRRPLSRYHASEMNARDHDFANWTPKESLQFSKHLLRIIRNAEVYAIAHAVILKDFVKVFPNVAEDPKGWAYMHCMMKCLLRVHEYFGDLIPPEARATNGIVTVFDRSNEYGKRARAALEKIHADPNLQSRSCFNSIIEGNNFTHIALQPTDLLAYELMREISRKAFSSSHAMRIFFQKMVKGAKVKVHATYSNEQYFRELKEAEIKRRAGSHTGGDPDKYLG